MLVLRFAIIALTLAFVGCAAKYHAAVDGSSGYRDIQVKPGVYYVEYTESANRNWEVVRQFALKRCAEIAKQQGYKFFDILSKDEKVVSLDSNVGQILIQTPGDQPGIGAPSHRAVSLEGNKVEGRRITYKIQLVNE